MAKCERCGKGPSFGQNRPFSLKATNRRFDANIHKVSLFVDGRRKRVTLCTRCMRTLTRP